MCLQPAPFIIDTDVGLDDLATIAIAASMSAPLRLVTTVSGLAPPGHGHQLARRLLDLVSLHQTPVVAGAELPPAHVKRRKQSWELSYNDRLSDVIARIGVEPVAVGKAEVTGDASSAARAIIDAAHADGGNASILALGALTNVAAAATLHPEEFARDVQRVVFIGDTDAEHQSYNVALDPEALRAVLGSGVELVLIGSACYASPQWVADLFGGGTGGSLLRVLGRSDPYAMCYDPLALLFHLEPEAFEVDSTPIPVRVTRGRDWRFERCEDSQRDGYVIEPSGVSLERYAAFLRSASEMD